MKMSIRLLALSIVLLLATACGGSGASVTPPAGDPAQPVSSGPASSAGPDSLNLGDPASFAELASDHTVTMNFNFTATDANGAPQQGAVQLDGSVRLNPPASRYLFTTSGAANANTPAAYEIVQIGEQSFFYAPQMGCIALAGEDQQKQYLSLTDTDGVLTGEAQRVLPDETINGVPAYRFAITQANLSPAVTTNLELHEITSGDIYMAKDGGYALRLQLTGRGVSSILGSGTETLEGDIVYQLDFTPVSSVGEIAAPESCAQAADPSQSEFPLMADATQVSSLGGLVRYYSASSLETIMDFYRTEMAAAGWSLGEDTVMATIGMLRFSSGGRVVGVVVSFDNTQNLNAVVIAEE